VIHRVLLNRVDRSNDSRSGRRCPRRWLSVERHRVGHYWREAGAPSCVSAAPSRYQALVSPGRTRGSCRGDEHRFLPQRGSSNDRLSWTCGRVFRGGVFGRGVADCPPTWRACARERDGASVPSVLAGWPVSV